MPVLSTVGIKDVIFRNTQAKQIYLGTKLVWEADQGPAARYSGTGWYKATDTGTVFCKGIPSLQTHTFTGDPVSYISVHTIEDIRKYPDRAAISNITSLTSVYSGLVVPATADFTNWDTSNVTTMQSAFFASTMFNQDISRWDTSNVTNMSNMFTFVIIFNQDISRWDTSKVTDMSGMFASASMFNQDISRWDTSKVTSMNTMFVYATAFNKNISGWNVSKVSNMLSMFSGATAFNQNLSKWCVTLIKTQPSYFKDGASLTAANTPRWGTCPAS